MSTLLIAAVAVAAVLVLALLILAGKQLRARTKRSRSQRHSRKAEILCSARISSAHRLTRKKPSRMSMIPTVSESFEPRMNWLQQPAEASVANRTPCGARKALFSRKRSRVNESKHG